MSPPASSLPPILYIVAASLGFTFLVLSLALYYGHRLKKRRQQQDIESATKLRPLQTQVPLRPNMNPDALLFVPVHGPPSNRRTRVGPLPGLPQGAMEARF